MAVRQVVKMSNGYRMVGRKGLVWLVTPNGGVLYCTSWQPRTEAETVGARAVLSDLAKTHEEVSSS